MERLRVIDSHTGGEPTRVVVEGLPDLPPKSMLGKRELLQRQYDRYRTAVIGEPRSSEVAVGAYLLPSESADYGVVFFNNVGYLGMCGHGTIGLVSTLAYLGRIEPGPVTFETPAGIVGARLHEDGSASFENVPAYRYRKDQRIELGSLGDIVGDIAYGGNWFFISSVHGHEVDIARIDALDIFASLVQDVIRIKGITGANDAPIDHIELTGKSEIADAKNYVRCPGGEYDRSPCGTGTSAKLACLFEDGKLVEGQTYRIESIIGSVFEGSIRKQGDLLIPTVKGRAYVNGDTTLLIDPDDPFAWGIPRA